MVRTGSAKSTDLSNSRKLKLAYGASTPKKKVVEKQGPIDWSCYGLKSKYRGEAEREEAWREWLNSASLSKTAMNENEMILPVTKVERHPFYTLFYKRLYEENLLSANRTQARLLMKRFVFDVEEVWLTNLHHLQEHKPENLFRSEDDSRHGSTNSSVASSPSKTQKVVESGGMNYGRGNGIKNRRDVKALTEGKSQIPSVSQQRVFDKAYHTTRLPAINVMLDYVPEPTAALKFDKLIPPVIEPLIDSIPLLLDPTEQPVEHHNQAAGRGFKFYTENDYVLHIDRLVPSSDYLVNIQSEVVWRFSLYRQTDMRHQYFIAAEANIAGYIAYTLNQRNQTGSHPVPVVNQLVYSTQEDVSIPWEGSPSTESQCNVTINVMGYRASECRAGKPDDTSPHARIKTIKLGLNVAVRPQRESDPWRNFYAECSPAEVKHLLHIPTSHLLTSLDFWLQSERCTDLFPKLIGKLALQFSGGDMVGVGFVSGERTAADRVAEALSTLEALSCAYELLDLLSLSPFIEPEKPKIEEPVEEEEVPEKGKKKSKKAKKNAKGAAAAAAAPVVVIKSLPELQFTQANTSFLVRPNVNAPEVKPYKVPKPIATAAAEEEEHSPVSSPTNRQRHHRPRSPSDHRGEAAPAPNLLETDRDMVLNTNIYRGLWEDIVSFSGHNLSLISSGGLAVVSQVPGAAEVGRHGLWFPDMNIAPLECTQAAANYFRDIQRSTTNSVMVNMTLALDTALLFATLIAWEDYSTHPVVNPAEEVTGIIPTRCFSSLALSTNPLLSPLTDRPSNTVVIFATLPVEGIDFMPRDAPQKPKGYCRNLPFRNQWGFRQQTEVTLLGVDPVLSTMVYGITRLGAQPNVLGVNPRNIWHRTIPITEAINRPRLPKDYHYIIANITTCGANDPTSYTTRMKASKMVGLTSSAFKKYEDKYNDIKELRNVFHRQLALDTKIEKVQNELKIKEKLQVSQIRDELQRGYEKKLRKATKSEVGWRSRFKMSSLIEIQGNWERRRDDRNNLYFFRRITPAFYNEQGKRENVEKFAETCQWEVPPAWDGDPLAAGSAMNTVQGGIMDGSTVMGGIVNPNAKSEVRPKMYTSSGASFYSEIEEDDLDLYDMPQVTAQKRQSAGIPLHHMQQGSGGGGAAGIAAGGGKKGPFDQPSDSWLPGNNTKQFAAEQSVVGGNNKDRQTQRLHDPHNLDYKDRTSQRKRAGSVTSVDSSRDLGSVGADKSVDESIAATIDTVNLEHIAEQLVSSDELMRVIARRLGLPESQIVPAEDLSSVFSVTSGNVPHVHGPNILHAPRDEWIDDLNEPEFDSDDDLWSDDDHAVGDYEVDKHIGEREDMPTNQLEAARLKRRQWREIHNKENFNAPAGVPYLHLPGAGGAAATSEGGANGAKEQGEESREEVFGWRRLPRPVLKEGFLSSSLLTHTRGPEKTSSNTLPAPIFLLPISPVDACKYIPTEFTGQIESIFIPDAKKDMERSIATVERNIKREEELSRNLPTDDLLLFGEAAEMTNVDAYLARQAKADMEQVADPTEAAITKAILAAKSSNIAAMEDALAEDIPINTADEFGNSLLILAAQQGSKRMCKFLLRRGANINFQSLAGNTPLHYCYAYSFHRLGDYLKSKGANDAIVNVDGLTCYEGLSKEGMAINFGDLEEDEEEQEEGEGEAGEGDYDEAEEDDYY